MLSVAFSFVILSIIIMSVIRQNVIMLSVVAPSKTTLTGAMYHKT
jgi:hypothetical protein